MALQLAGRCGQCYPLLLQLLGSATSCCPQFGQVLGLLRGGWASSSDLLAIGLGLPLQVFERALGGTDFSAQRLELLDCFLLLAQLAQLGGGLLSLGAQLAAQSLGKRVKAICQLRNIAPAFGGVSIDF